MTPVTDGVESAREFRHPSGMRVLSAGFRLPLTARYFKAYYGGRDGTGTLLRFVRGDKCWSGVYPMTTADLLVVC